VAEGAKERTEGAEQNAAAADAMAIVAIETFIVVLRGLGLGCQKTERCATLGNLVARQRG